MICFQNGNSKLFLGSFHAQLLLLEKMRATASVALALIASSFSAPSQPALNHGSRI